LKLLRYSVQALERIKEKRFDVVITDLKIGECGWHGHFVGK